MPVYHVFGEGEGGGGWGWAWKKIGECTLCKLTSVRFLSTGSSANGKCKKGFRQGKTIGGKKQQEISRRSTKEKKEKISKHDLIEGHASVKPFKSGKNQDNGKCKKGFRQGETIGSKNQQQPFGTKEKSRKISKTWSNLEQTNNEKLQKKRLSAGEGKRGQKTK